MGCRGVGYNNLGAYVIEAHSDAPLTDAGWVALVEVTDNTFHSRQHLLELDGFRWLRLRAVASDGSPQNSDIAINLDLYDVGSDIDDGWIFYGDSITAAAMDHGAGSVAPGEGASFSQQVDERTNGAVFPPQENGGVPCITTDDLVAVFNKWLANFPGRYVVISLGTNDAMGVPPERFYDNYATLVAAVLDAGKVPIVPTIPWSPDPERQTRTLELNAELARLYTNYPDLIQGPNLWTYFAERPELISDDTIHPTPQGYLAYRAVWAAFAAETIYGAELAAPAP